MVSLPTKEKLGKEKIVRQHNISLPQVPKIAGPSGAKEMTLQKFSIVSTVERDMDNQIINKQQYERDMDNP